MKQKDVKKVSLTISLLICVCILAFSLAYYINWKDVDTEGDNEINSLLSPSNHAFFDPVLPGSPLFFPKDFGEHTSFQHEKWVMTVNAVDQEGNSLGIQWTMFRVSNDDRETKGWLDPRLYVAKVIITTKNGKWVDERLARGGIGQAGLSQSPYRIWIDNWHWRSLGQGPFPGLLSAESGDFSLKLSVNANDKPIPLGNDGYSKKHDLIPVASHEYIFPFVNVRGNITLDNKAYTISGKAILEHEWASGFLDEDQQGWDWFIINLTQESKLLVAQYRHKEQAPYLYGALLYKNGDYVLLSGNDVTLQTLPARKLKNGRKLPLQWVINIPEYGLNLTTQVMRNEQWLDTLIPYWQGPITTTGSHQVTGFMQLTGY
ncbi:lipocalin-like domain-containing protein [Aliivibrio sp. S4TY2]|uniref:lipocalin-like domain-containing protein n=1 Tax=unclassified Aliivibrio TaxID=2645654 RepID=UPI0023780331|nr:MULTISPECIES: lipocalin-like domain-containing protein [unclassified Aliivibrio]MDD9156543.1 lipocalin-like domain-containing protein [Aliivibrio sp. S4TY2]MDD9160020.1 lipocalin-like domain-containing protein [Aliivibrio sp. S4TY1]MDD9164242.1 lipocalin-like domain-containing protein [Aliivibrio sp. S4MY2]MDD9168250.1 lipocalin-like domain-containing protein [Aliivibrio sp. S4MY4]MDD9184586.1 lipocalin-like domain-containing protein [Aliivibrio sp. S4MY3]